MSETSPATPGISRRLELTVRTPSPDRLRPDCSQCFGLCCVALAFTASADFAMDKTAGAPCSNLQEDFLCGIHSALRPQGFKGCTVFDCFGAGQQVSQVTFKGRSWREEPKSAPLMYSAFSVMRQLHEYLWYLAQAQDVMPAGPLREEAARMLIATDELTQKSPDILTSLDLTVHRDQVNTVLTGVSEHIREAAVRGRKGGKGSKALPKTVGPGADLIGAKLSGADLRGANLRGAYLIAANLTQADLRAADVIGADLRDANVAGADFSTSLFLTQAQVNSAKGNRTTTLPPTLVVPSHW